jgi:hypothetical protein
MPTHILVGNITDTSADLLWTQMPNTNYYEYKVDPASNVFNSNGAITINKFNAHVATLAPVTEYYVYVRGRCYTNDSSLWAVDSFETLPACNPPVVQVNVLAPDQYDASWNGIQGALGYETAVTNEPIGPALGNMTLDNFLKVTLPADGKNYHLHVRTICSSMPVFSDWHSQPLRLIPEGINDMGVKGNIILYPNPVTNELSIAGTEGSYAIYDMSSRLIKTGTITSKLNKVTTAGFSPGIYVLKINTAVLRFLKTD